MAIYKKLNGLIPKRLYINYNFLSKILTKISGLLLLTIATLNFVYWYLYHYIGLTTVFMVSLIILLGGVYAIKEMNIKIVILASLFGLIPLSWLPTSLLSFISFMLLIPKLDLNSKTLFRGERNGIQTF